MNRSKVAICGSASTSAHKAPVDDDSFDIWGLAWRSDLKRCDRAFDMHPIDASRKRIPPNYKEFLAAKNIPIFHVDALPEVPLSIRYPIEEVIAFFSETDPGFANGNYFVSSIAYMIALAIFEDYKEIHLYGVDLIDDDEYAHQRPNTEYLIGLARGRGIKVYIPQESALLKYTHLYGYEKAREEGLITAKVLESRIAKYKERMDKALAEAHTCDGAIQEANGLLVLLKHHSRGVNVDGRE